MKKLILLGAILSIFLMMMMPNINAVNYQVHKYVIEENAGNFNLIIKDILSKHDKKRLSFSSFVNSIINFIMLYLFIGFCYAFEIELRYLILYGFNFNTFIENIESLLQTFILWPVSLVLFSIFVNPFIQFIINYTEGIYPSFLFGIISSISFLILYLVVHLKLYHTIFDTPTNNLQYIISPSHSIN